MSFHPDTTSINYSYDPLSRLTAATNGNRTINFSDDNRSRVASTTDVWNQTIAQTYDANGNRTATTLGGTAHASYAYDALNRLTQLNDHAGLPVSYSYDATRLTARILPNGVTSTYAYDGLDRLTSLHDATATSVILDNQYGYNTAGQIVQQVDAGGAHAYGYDTADRLNSATYPGVTPEAYGYDSVGNRISSHLSPSYGYQTFNQLSSTSAASYTYDNNGNLVSKTDSSGTWQYTWDYENRLTQATRPDAVTINYSYDALGRGVQRTSSAGATQKYVLDGQDVVADLDENDEIVTTYLNGPGIDNKIRQTDATNGNLYYSTDHLGSTRALTNDAGTVSEQLAYDTFGSSPGSAYTRYTYTGRESDPDTGLMYYRARWYDPQVGRFISEDPIGFSGGDLDLYAYVRGNPVNLTDPTGMQIRSDRNWNERDEDPITHKTLHNDFKQAAGMACALNGLNLWVTTEGTAGFQFFNFAGGNASVGVMINLFTLVDTEQNFRVGNPQPERKPLANSRSDRSAPGEAGLSTGRP